MTSSSLNGSSAAVSTTPSSWSRVSASTPAAGIRPVTIDVAGLVDGVGEPGQAQVAAQQEAVDLVVVLVGVADDERRHRQGGVGHDDRGHRLELLLAGQRHDVLVVARARLPVVAGLGEVGLDGRRDGGAVGHGMTACGMPVRVSASLIDASRGRAIASA